MLSHIEDRMIACGSKVLSDYLVPIFAFAEGKMGNAYRIKYRSAEGKKLTA